MFKVLSLVALLVPVAVSASAATYSQEQLDIARSCYNKSPEPRSVSPERPATPPAPAPAPADDKK